MTDSLRDWKWPGISQKAWNILVEMAFGFTYCLNWIRHLTNELFMSISTFINVKIYNTYGSTSNWIQERGRRPNCNLYWSSIIAIHISILFLLLVKLLFLQPILSKDLGSCSQVDFIDMQSSHLQYTWIMVY